LRGERYALRWLGRWLEDAREATLDEIVLVVSGFRGGRQLVCA
jgi:hypothetical protein